VRARIPLLPVAIRAIRIAISIASAVSVSLFVVRPAEPAAAGYPIDLPTVLRLAGARNLDVQIASQRLDEARANRSSALEQFFPSLSPGVTYHRRDGMAQAVPAGTITDTHFQSYAPGGTFAAQLAIGDAIYQSLAAKQLVTASRHALETQRQDSRLSAAQGYFDLVKDRALAEVVKETMRISADYQHQLHGAVEAGIAFKGDELRVQTQTESYQIVLRQVIEQQRLAAASLAEILHLDPAVELIPRDADLAPLVLFPTNAAMSLLVQQALSSRPELKQGEALVKAATDAKTGALYGPLIPSIGAQMFLGGMGGGHDDAPSSFGDSEDYLVGLGWRIGPGGLFDSGRVKASKARLAAAEFGEAKVRDSISSQVVAALSRVQSLSDQIRLAEENLNTANETLRLTRQRKEYGVGIVLEDIQAQQELIRTRTNYLTTVAEFNKAQYGLSRAVGGLQDEPTGSRSTGR